jgi:hypothetical protein
VLTLLAFLVGLLLGGLLTCILVGILVRRVPPFLSYLNAVADLGEVAPFGEDGLCLTPHDQCPVAWRNRSTCLGCPCFVPEVRR